MNMKTTVGVMLLSGLLFLGGIFQNCASSVHEAAPSSVVLEEFFAYPYTNAEDHFINIQLLRPATSDTKFNDLKFFAALTPSSGQVQTIPWRVTILDPNGFPVCPERTGTLSDGRTTILTDCVSSSGATEVIVTLYYTPPGQSSERSHQVIYK
ncbi:MAG: hypothetical protein AB7G93_09695 [Bdellovibrionales bacterium]